MENVVTFEYLEMKFKIKILRINKLNKVKLKEFLTPYIRLKIAVSSSAVYKRKS